VKFKPGDIIVWNSDKVAEILLVLEVDFDRRTYKTFTLSDNVQYVINKTREKNFGCSKYFSLLQDKVLSEQK